MMSNEIMAINCPKSDVNNINLVLEFKMVKIIKRALSGAKLHAILENKATTELQGASCKAKAELPAKLKEDHK